MQLSQSTVQRIKSMNRNLILIILLALLGFVSCGSPGDGSGNLDDNIPTGGRRIFITSTTYQGDFGGLSAADSICNTRAQAAGLSKTYRSVLGSSALDVKNRFSGTESVYTYGDGNYHLVVSQLSNLWNTNFVNLSYAISYDEYGDYSSSKAWSGSVATGEEGTAQSCETIGNSWTSNNSLDTGTIGDSSAISADWIELMVDDCSQSYAIYCLSI